MDAANVDILWNVFNMIVDTYPSSSDMDSLRSASQVCTTWRSIILSSSSIWALLINLDFFALKSEQWFMEVLRRTGDSPLYIECCHPDNPWIDTFLERLLFENWHRIKLLSLIIADGTIFEMGLRDLLRTQSPLLQEFKLEIIFATYDSYETENSSNIMADFGDYAPAMLHFDASTLTILPQSSWLSNLRVWSFTLNFQLSLLLDILPSMPYLEDLTIKSPHRKCIQDTLTSVPLSPLPLPNLRMLKIVATTQDWIRYIALVECIQPAEEYYLDLEAGSRDAIPNKQDISRLSNIIGTYIGNFKENEFRDSLQLRCYGDQRLSISSDIFTLRVEFSLMDYYSDTAILLRSFFSNPRYWKHVTRFWINLFGVAQSQTDPTLPMFIHNHLNSVTCLNIHGCYTLGYITQWPTLFPDAVPLLPNIETLHIWISPHDLSNLHVIHDFLQYRIDVLGRPLQTLAILDTRAIDLTNCLTSLDQFTGLKVVIERCSSSATQSMPVVEYICGSGNPEVLFLCHWESSTLT